MTQVTALPRLGSWVRIPSPAPNFINNFSILYASLACTFLLPRGRATAREAAGKQLGAKSAHRRLAWRSQTSTDSIALCRMR